MNIAHKPLVDRDRIYLPPFHIKLGLMKNFVKAMDKSGVGFNYLKVKFPRISDAKIKGGIFIGPQIREIMSDNHFDELLKGAELTAWKSLKDVAYNFLGYHKASKLCQTGSVNVRGISEHEM